MDDITELLFIPEFQKAFGNNIFYTISEQKKKPIFLTDIFTVFSAKQKINLAYMSDSLAALFGLKRAEQWAQKSKEEMLVRMKDDKKPPTNTKDQWNMYLKNIYGKEFSVFPKIAENFLEFSIEPGVFAVVSQATIGALSQKALVMLKKSQTNKPQTFSMMRFYWL